MARRRPDAPARLRYELEYPLLTHVDERVHARVDYPAGAFIKRLDLISNNNIGNRDFFIFSADVAIALRLLPFLFLAAQFRIPRYAL